MLSSRIIFSCFLFYQKDILTFNCAPRKQTRHSSLRTPRKTTDWDSMPSKSLGMWSLSGESRQVPSTWEHLGSLEIFQSAPNVFQKCKGCWSKHRKIFDASASWTFFRVGGCFRRNKNAKKDDSLIPTHVSQVCLERRTQKHEYFDAHQTPKVISTATASKLINPSLSFTFKHFQTKSHANCTKEPSHSIQLYLETLNFNIFNLGLPNNTCFHLQNPPLFNHEVGLKDALLPWEARKAIKQSTINLLKRIEISYIYIYVYIYIYTENKNQISPNSAQKLSPIHTKLTEETTSKRMVANQLPTLMNNLSTRNIPGLPRCFSRVFHGDSGCSKRFHGLVVGLAHLQKKIKDATQKLRWHQPTRTPTPTPAIFHITFGISIAKRYLLCSYQ